MLLSFVYFTYFSFFFFLRMKYSNKNGCVKKKRETWRESEEKSRIKANSDEKFENLATTPNKRRGFLCKYEKCSISVVLYTFPNVLNLTLTKNTKLHHFAARVSNRPDNKVEHHVRSSCQRSRREFFHSCHFKRANPYSHHAFFPCPIYTDLH